MVKFAALLSLLILSINADADETVPCNAQGLYVNASGVGLHERPVESSKTVYRLPYGLYVCPDKGNESQPKQDWTKVSLARDPRMVGWVKSEFIQNREVDDYERVHVWSQKGGAEGKKWAERAVDLDENEDSLTQLLHVYQQSGEMEKAAIVEKRITSYKKMMDGFSGKTWTTVDENGPHIFHHTHYLTADFVSNSNDKSKADVIREYGNRGDKTELNSTNSYLCLEGGDRLKAGRIKYEDVEEGEGGGSPTFPFKTEFCISGVKTSDNGPFKVFDFKALLNLRKEEQ